MNIWRISIGALLATACTGKQPGRPDEGPRGPDTRSDPIVVMPALEREALALDPDHDPPRPNSSIAVSSKGTVVFTNPRHRRDRNMLTVAQPGSPPRELIRKGSGPGEVADGSLIILFLDTLLLVDDLEQARTSLFTSRGVPIDDGPVPFGWYLLGSQGDSLDYFAAHSPEGQSAVYRRLMLGREDRIVIPHDDPFLTKAAPPVVGTALSSPPAYAVLGGRIAVAEPRGYRIRYYDREGGYIEFGRDLSPRRRTRAALDQERRRIRQQLRMGFVGPDGKRMPVPGLQERLDTLDREVLPHFTRHGLAFDHAGRLWVVGETGDSSFADVFADTTFLGRIALPCRGPGRSISFNERWLAMICLADNDEPEIQFYRVEDPT